MRSSTTASAVGTPRKKLKHSDTGTNCRASKNQMGRTRDAGGVTENTKVVFLGTVVL